MGLSDRPEVNASPYTPQPSRTRRPSETILRNARRTWRRPLRSVNSRGRNTYSRLSAMRFSILDCRELGRAMASFRVLYQDNRIAGTNPDSELHAVRAV